MFRVLSFTALILVMQCLPLETIGNLRLLCLFSWFLSSSVISTKDSLWWLRSWWCLRIDQKYAITTACVMWLCMTLAALSVSNQQIELRVICCFGLALTLKTKEMCIRPACIGHLWDRLVGMGWSIIRKKFLKQPFVCAKRASNAKDCIVYRINGAWMQFFLFIPGLRAR